MFTVQFWKETTERAVKSFAQGALWITGLGEGFSLFDVDLTLVLGGGGGMALLSLLTSLASAPFGQGGTPSLVPTIDAPPIEPAAVYEKEQDMESGEMNAGWATILVVVLVILIALRVFGII